MTTLVTTPLDVQIGGDHYKDKAIQPITYIQANNLGFLEGCVIKRVTRWKEKNGVEDLRKAVHELELLIHFSMEKAADQEHGFAQEKVEGHAVDFTPDQKSAKPRRPKAKDVKKAIKKAVAKRKQSVQLSPVQRKRLITAAKKKGVSISAVAKQFGVSWQTAKNIVTAGA